MLSQIVRPMVRTQLRLLANTQATRSTLVQTIAQWLGFLGVHAEVTELDTQSQCIRVSLTVGKPEACDPHDWEQILRNLDQSRGGATAPSLTALNSKQEVKLQRLLAYVIQVGGNDSVNGSMHWESLQPQLESLGLNATMQMGIRSALKVPQSLDQLMEGLDADVAAIALSKAVGIALLDRRVNPQEDKALSALLEVMKQPVVAQD
ncbi:MAG: hypothetical protein Kow00121_63980 [Elainellaceae cyanobacterium]